MIIPISGASLLNKIDWINIKSRQFLDLFFLPLDYLGDMASLWLHSRLSPLARKNSKNIYDLIFFSHTIEKGLALKEPREQFGRNNIARVVMLLKKSQPQDLPEYVVSMAMGSLVAYVQHHASCAISSPYLDELNYEITALRNKFPVFGQGGKKDVSDVYKNITSKYYNYSDFLLSRYSCREFEERVVERTLIEDVVRVAQQSPSQCNRQSVRLHVYQTPNEIQNLLNLQGGSRGFSHQVPMLVIICSDSCAWMSRAERNQFYVDGGIYAMSLLLACHAVGLGTCPLNFSKTYSAERRFKKCARIPSNERVVLLVAVGWPSTSSAKAAVSARMDQTLVTTHHT